MFSTTKPVVPEPKVVEYVEDEDPARQHHEMNPDDYSPNTEFQFGEL
jgi:hypothetical protein